MKFFSQSPVPVPMPVLSAVINQIEAQGWTFHSAVMIGAVQKAGVISANNKPVPAFMLLICKESVDGEQPEVPHVDIRF